MNTLYHKKRDCKQGNRCKLYKKCEKCNQIRQARLSDAAELASRFSNTGYYSVVLPHSQEKPEKTIKALKAKINRKIRPIAKGVMTTVEVSEHGSLHINNLILTDKELSPTVIENILIKDKIEANYFFEQIDLKDVRKVTAYMNKYQQIPTTYEYNGNIYNTSGNLKTCLQALQTERAINRYPKVAYQSVLLGLGALGLPIDKYLLQHSPVMRAKITDIAKLLNQIDKIGMCYSPTRGVMTIKEFKAAYNRLYDAAISKS